MADMPVPGGAEHGVVNPPNVQGPAGHKAANGYLPLAKGASTCNPPNKGMGGDRREGTMPLGGQGVGVNPQNHAFQVGMAKMPNPGSAETPGKGTVPVYPMGTKGAGVIETAFGKAAGG